MGRKQAGGFVNGGRLPSFGPPPFPWRPLTLLLVVSLSFSSDSLGLYTTAHLLYYANSRRVGAEGIFFVGAAVLGGGRRFFITWWAVVDTR